MDLASQMAAAAEGGPPAAGANDDGKLLNLGVKIATNECYAKNVDSRFPMTNLFIGDSRLGCKSDADEQLILHVSFQEFVKLHSIKFTEFNTGTDPESNPSKIHIFMNREVGFEDWEDIDPTQTLHLTAEDLKESADPTALKYVKFQRVRNITLFIEDNAGGDISALGSLKFMGRPVLTVNMDDFKAQKG